MRQCSFFEHMGKNIMYRRYASLFFIVGTEDEVRSCLPSPPSRPRHPPTMRESWGRYFEHTRQASMRIRRAPQATCCSPVAVLSVSRISLSPAQNELAILEFIHSFVETLDRYFENVCELDIMKNLEAVHFMLNEMVMNGCIVETNKQNIMAPIMLMDKYTAKGR